MISEKIETNSKKDPPPKKKVILEQTSGHFTSVGWFLSLTPVMKSVTTNFEKISGRQLSYGYVLVINLFGNLNLNDNPFFDQVKYIAIHVMQTCSFLCP